MRWYELISRFVIETKKPVSTSKHRTLTDYVKTVAEIVEMKLTKAEEVDI